MAGIEAQGVLGAIVALFGAGGVGSWLAARAKGRVDLVTVAQDAAKEVIASLREEIERQGKRIDELEAEAKATREERHTLRNELTKERQLRREAEARAAAAEARCEEMLGQVRQLEQRTDSLQRQLVAAGIAIDGPGPRDSTALLLAAPGA